AQHPPRRLPDDGERLGQQVVEILPVLEALAELGGLGDELIVGEGLDLRLEGRDLGDDSLQRLDLPTFAQVEDLVESSHRESSLPTSPRSAAPPIPANRTGRSGQWHPAVLPARPVAADPEA